MLLLQKLELVELAELLPKLDSRISSKVSLGKVLYIEFVWMKDCIVTYSYLNRILRGLQGS